MNIKNIINSYLDQHIIAFHSGAIGGFTRGGDDIARYRQSRSDSPPHKKRSSILIGVPSHAVKGTGMKEVSHAYRAFTDAGYAVDFLTADGSPVEFSQSDLTDPINRWFIEDANARYKSDQPINVKDVKPGRHIAVYFAGGNGLFTENQWFQTLAEQILNNGGVVAGSGDADQAVQNLRLSDRINSGYSLPASRAGRLVSQYGSAAVEAVMEEAGWVIHNDELLVPDTEDITDIGKRVVMLLAS